MGGQGPEAEGYDRQGVGASEPAADERLAVDRFVLANGLEVWHKERAGTGTVSIVLVVRVGARNETPQNNGISHFVEHMLFDGTECRDEYEIKEVIRRRGGYYNAATDYESTVVEAHLLAKDLELALDWLTDIVFRSTFPADKVARERQVLIQEKGGRSSRVLDALESWGFGYDLGLTIRQRLFPGSSLGLRVAGEDASLDRIDREMLRAYHERYYRPNNMALVVVGDVTNERVHQAAVRYLGEFAPAPVPATPPVPPAVGQPVTVWLRGPHIADRAAMRYGARTVGAGHPDAVVLEVLAEVLSDRLTDEVRLRQGLVYSIGAYHVALSDTGYFAVRTESDGGKMKNIVATVEQHMQRLCSEPVPDDELCQAKATLQGQFALATQSNPSLAWLFADYAVWNRAGEPVPDRHRQIEAVQPEDILRVGQCYFVPENSYLGLYRPVMTAKTGALGIAAAAALFVGLGLSRRLYRRGGAT